MSFEDARPVLTGDRTFVPYRAILEGLGAVVSYDNGNIQAVFEDGSVMKLAIGFLIGLILPAIYLYLRAIFQTKFSTKEEVERMTHIPILGELCTHHSSNNIVVHEGDNSSISDIQK